MACEVIREHSADVTDASAKARSSAPPLAPGDVLIPGYRINAHLSRGNTFDIYDVWSEERACRAVAKVYREGSSASARQRLIDEGRLLERLRHLHLVRAYETCVGPTPATAVILETLTGETLGHLVARRRRRRLSIREVSFLGLHVCSAVHYLHGNGVLHRDLKPSNVVCERGIAKVIDLSLAGPPHYTRGGTGTPQYMAPEQVRGGLIDTPTDVWGIGALLYEAATGEMPFGTKRNALEQVKRRAWPLRSRRRAPSDFAAAIDGCLAPDMGERPTLDELADVFARFAGAAPAPGASQPEVPSRA